jgi:glycosyltransferase involved in cell wall biosynthesis
MGLITHMTGRVMMLSTNLARGGAETQVVHLAHGLRQRGWDVSVISMLPPSAFEEELAACCVPVYSLGMRPGVPSPLGFARLVALLGKLRPQVLHCHMFHANLLGRAARLVCPVPALISTIHSAAESSRSSGSTRLRDRLYRLTSPLADVTTRVCRTPGRKLVVIPNGVDTTRFRSNPIARERVRHKLGVDDEFVWLAVGRLMWKKDYATMLRAFAAQHGGVLLIAGEGPQEAELRTLANTNVRFLGLRKDVPELMSACDGYLLSSVIEGLPLTLLEAASSGVPAVATAVGGVADIVLDGRTGFVVPPGDVEAFGSAMSRIARMSTEERARMGQAARNHAVANFDIQAVVERWERLYTQLLTLLD